MTRAGMSGTWSLTPRRSSRSHCRTRSRSSPALAARAGNSGDWRAIWRAIAPDVLFAPGYTAPLTAPCPIALTIHDVSFAAHPEWFSAAKGAPADADRLVGATRTRRADRLAVLPRRDRAASRHAARRITVVPLGRNRAPSIARDATREPLMLYVGSIFRRRHVDRLIAAFVRRVAPQVPGSRLEIVGENRTYPPQDVTAALRHVPAGHCRAGVGALVRRRGHAARSLLARDGLRVPVRIRRLRPDAARGAGRGRATGRARHAGGARGVRARRALRREPGRRRRSATH